VRRIQSLLPTTKFYVCVGRYAVFHSDAHLRHQKYLFLFSDNTSASVPSQGSDVHIKPGTFENDDIVYSQKALATPAVRRIAKENNVS